MSKAVPACKVIRLKESRQNHMKNMSRYAKGFYANCYYCEKPINAPVYVRKVGHHGNTKWYHLACAEKVGLQPVDDTQA